MQKLCIPVMIALLLLGIAGCEKPDAAPGDTTVGMYLQVICDLHENEAERPVKSIALDLSGAGNLSEEEKADLVSAVQSSYPAAEVSAATYDQLTEDGRMENGVFGDGVLFTLSVIEADEQEIAFEVSKWHAPDDACGYDRCRASLENGQWEVTLDDSWAA